MYSDTFNISHIISQFIFYSLENGNKIWLRVKQCQNKFILIMSDNFDRTVYVMDYNQPEIQITVSVTIFTQLNQFKYINTLLTNYQAMLHFIPSVV